MIHHLVLHVISKLVIPLILLFALYVQFHGDFGPGGGFQAGVIFASGFILYALIFGVDTARRVFPSAFTRALAGLGLALFAGVGIVTLWLGGNYLDYDALLPGHHGGQHLGIVLIEVGVGMTVAGVMITIFFAFAGRGRHGPDTNNDKQD